MQTGQTNTGSTQWTRHSCDDLADLLGFADMVEGGRAALERLFSHLQNAALPPGAVVEIEFAVRRRATVIRA